ncbi:MAG TPA: ricin-type beta-trefoil lectin domain protein [Streptosporangiaceae bacterium]|nr:ricin-type beta-trefoil lectin domain protein [Streptosporangiaceae bacterium]
MRRRSTSFLPAQRRRIQIQAAVAVLTTAAAAAGLTAIVASGPAYAQAGPLPTHVFAPYFEAYNGDNPVTLSQQSGAKYLTFAFIQTASSGSCTAYWNGDTSTPLTAANFGSDISTIQSDGGNVIPSFGGASADNSGTDIADSCTNVSSIAKVYENVITTYNISRIDLDIEGDSLNNTAGINRRNEAVAQVESWAASNGRSIQFSYTMPSDTDGLESDEISVLKNAKTDGATVSVVNLMTFDYYIGTKQEMATDTETAGEDLVSQLKSLYPSDSSAQLWGMVGITEMPGIDDYGADETFTEADATTVLNWAQSEGISTLSFWALQRDNGGCPGTKGSDTCSGISQPTWYFSNKFEPFTSGSSGSGGTTITGNYSGLCLSVSGASTAPKATADIYTCNGSPSENWTVNTDGTITGDHSGLCLSVSGGATAPKSAVEIYTCNGSASEYWTVNSNGTITGNNSGLCLSVAGGSTAPYSVVDIYTCNGSPSENWTVG